MKSWSLFQHSLRQVVGNLPAALRISGVLFAVQTAVALAVGYVLTGPMAGGGQAGATTVLVLPAILIAVLVVVIGLWIGVAWHRYVLTEEMEPGLIPAFHGDRMAAYFGKGILVGLVLILPIFFLSLLVASLIQAPLPQGGASGLMRVLDLGVQAVVGGVAFRLAAVLPGVALEPGHGVMEGWQATRGHTLTLMGLALICGLALTGLDMVLSVLPPLLPLQVLVAVAVQWLTTMVGISILTTLYGHYLQGRPLVG